MDKNQPKFTLTAAALIILIAVVAAYSNSLTGTFLFDDGHQIAKNPNVRTLTNIPRYFVDASVGSSSYQSLGYRPVTYSSFAINYAVSGYSPWSYHLLNLLLHALNAFLVFLLVRRVLHDTGHDDPFYVALFASLVFAVHPIQTGGVTYISGRASLLAALFYLAGFICFMRFRDGTARRFVWVALSVLCYLLGLLSKEVAVSLPAALLAYDLIIIYPKRGWRATSVKPLLAYAPFAAALVFYLAVRRSLTGYVAAPEWYTTPLVYLMSQAKGALMYLRLLVLPINQNVDYDIAATARPEPLVFVSVAIFGLLLYWLLRLRRALPSVTFFGLWALVAALPESSVIPIPDLFVEYRMYLPSVGFIAALTVVSGRVVMPPSYRKPLAASVVALLCVLTFNRNFVWADEYSLWGDAVVKAPYSPRTHANYGSALLRRGQFSEGADELTRSLEIDPMFDQSYNVYNDLGQCYMNMGRVDEALTQYETATAMFPGFVEGFINAGVAYMRLGRPGDAVTAFRKATLLDPSNELAHYSLGWAYKGLGRLDDALPELKEAERLAPYVYNTRMELAELYAAKGMAAESSSEAEAAYGLAKDDSQRRDAKALIK